MDFWAYYFFAKLFLYFGKYIDFHLWPNLAFAAVLAPPLPRLWMRATRTALAVPASLALLYYDSWLPPVGRVLQQAPALSTFDGTYLVELLGRFINPQVCLLLLAMLAVYALLSLRLRMRTFAVLAMLATPLYAKLPALFARPAPVAAANAASTEVAAAADLSDAGLNNSLAKFFDAEKRRRVEFPTLPAAASPYDVIFLQICSLSWDDLRAVKLDDAPQLKRFDLLFSKFNTAASYSGPAAIRLLRSSCGQPAHDALYAKAPMGCSLMGELQRAGFEPAWLMNHDGKFGGFADDIVNWGGMTAPRRGYPDLPTVQREFDGSALQSDYAVLARWWQERLANPAPHVALYYNTASLHDGNRLVDAQALPVQQSYQVRASRLLADVTRFTELIEKSNRRALVVLVPEHGANVRGDRMQISGLREIPTPAITLGPVGVAIVGPGVAHGPQLNVTAPTALLGLADLLAKLMANDPFTLDAAALEQAARAIAQTPLVAQNQDNIVMDVGGRTMLKQPGGAWTEYVSGTP